MKLLSFDCIYKIASCHALMGNQANIFNPFSLYVQYNEFLKERLYFLCIVGLMVRLIKRLDGSVTGVRGAVWLETFITSVRRPRR